VEQSELGLNKLWGLLLRGADAARDSTAAKTAQRVRSTLGGRQMERVGWVLDGELRWKEHAQPRAGGVGRFAGGWRARRRWALGAAVQSAAATDAGLGGRQLGHRACARVQPECGLEDPDGRS
jgi:hypothetical protein